MAFLGPEEAKLNERPSDFCLTWPRYTCPREEGIDTEGKGVEVRRAMRVQFWWGDSSRQLRMNYVERKVAEPPLAVRDNWCNEM